MLGASVTSLKYYKIHDNLKKPLNTTECFGRALKNVVNTLRDAVSRSINLFIGQIGGKVAGGRVTQDLTSVSSVIVGTVGNTYDPVLEKYIGRWVVVELNEGGSLKKYEGILKEYTAKYLELLNVRYNFGDESDTRQYKSIDLIAPRTLIKVRHGGKKEKLSLKELLGLDNIIHNKTGTLSMLPVYMGGSHRSTPFFIQFHPSSVFFIFLKLCRKHSP